MGVHVSKLVLRVSAVFGRGPSLELRGCPDQDERRTGVQSSRPLAIHTGPGIIEDGITWRGKMATYWDYRFYNALGDAALDAAMEVDRSGRGDAVEPEAVGRFLDVVRDALAEAREKNPTSISALHQLWKCMAGDVDDGIRTVSDLLAVVETWIAERTSDPLGRDEARRKRFMDELLSAHSFAISRLYDTIRERRSLAA
jgi:hypothetical protein